VTLSISKKALSLSSDRTVNRRPSRLYASAVNSTRPVESICDEQPQLQPALLKCSKGHGRPDGCGRPAQGTLIHISIAVPLFSELRRVGSVDPRLNGELEIDYQRNRVMFHPNALREFTFSLPLTPSDVDVVRSLAQITRKLETHSFRNYL